MITLDTSTILALFNQMDANHRRTRDALDAEPGPYTLPMGIFAEVTYMIEQRFGAERLGLFLKALADGS